MTDPSDRLRDPRVTALRADLRARRRDLQPPDRTVATTAIIERLLSLSELGSRVDAGRANVGLFSATDGEVDLTSIAPVLRSRGWRTFLPLVGDDRSMAFASWSGHDTLVPGRFGIPVPARPTEQVLVGELDVVVVPCVAVDLSGNRLGFGAGFYDRALAPRAPSTVLLAPVFDFCVVERIEPRPWDVPVDVVVTEVREHRPLR